MSLCCVFIQNAHQQSTILKWHIRLYSMLHCSVCDAHQAWHTKCSQWQPGEACGAPVLSWGAWCLFWGNAPPCQHPEHQTAPETDHTPPCHHPDHQTVLETNHTPPCHHPEHQFLKQNTQNHVNILNTEQFLKQDAHYHINTLNTKQLLRQITHHINT